MTQELDPKELYEISKFLKSNFASQDLSFQQIKTLHDARPKCLLSNLSRREADEWIKNFQSLSLSATRTEIPRRKNRSLAFGFALLFLIGLGLIWLHLFWKIPYLPSQNMTIVVDVPTSENTSVVGDFSWPSTRFSETEPHSQSPSDLIDRERILKALNASVSIKTPQSQGAGFLISSDGYILTNTHVLAENQSPLVILRNGQSFSAKRIRTDPRVDLSLLKIEARNLDFLEMGDAHELYPGQTILSIGNPSGLSFTLTRGIISYVGREISGVSYIQTDAAINPGNSGGPMISSDFKVVGINTLTVRGEKGISFALPINYAYVTEGIAKGLGSHPPLSRGFEASHQHIVTKSLETSQSPYQQEAQTYWESLEKTKTRLFEENQLIIEELDNLRAAMKHRPPGVLEQRRIQSRLKDLQSEHSQLSIRLRDAQIRYIRQMQSLLQRQKGDSRFFHLSEKIDLQIADLEDQKKKLENQSEPQ